MEEVLVCRDDLDPTEPTLSKSPPKYRPSSLPFFLSFLLPREKNDFPPDDCLDLLSAPDMVESLLACLLNGHYTVYKITAGFDGVL